MILELILTANQERKLLGSRRLAKAAEQAAITQKYERNEKLAFDTMINSLQVVTITFAIAYVLFQESGRIYKMTVYAIIRMPCDDVIHLLD